MVYSLAYTCHANYTPFLFLFQDPFMFKINVNFLFSTEKIIANIIIICYNIIYYIKEPENV